MYLGNVGYSMNVIDTKINDVKIIEPVVFGDHRGFFMETFERNRYQKMLNIDYDFVQDNYSRSVKGVLRGLHFQRSNPQGKLVRVVRGEVYDVAVDIRKGSPTYGKWEAVVLSEENKKQFWIPPGLAHGFLVLSDVADLEYKCTSYYDPSSEQCLFWADEDVNVQWPELDVPLRLSEKDKSGKKLCEL